MTVKLNNNKDKRWYWNHLLLSLTYSQAIVHTALTALTARIVRTVRIVRIIQADNENYSYSMCPLY